MTSPSTPFDATDRVTEWPLDRHDVVRFVVAYLGLCAAWITAGLLITGPLEDWIGSADARVIDNFAAHRTPRLDTWSHYGTLLAETQTKIVLTGVIAIVLLVVYRSWHWPLLVALPLVLEASVFITVTFVVGRHRPDVVRLDGSPVDSSFPSGHVAAAVVYGAFAVLAYRLGHRIVAAVLAVFTLVVAVIVAWSRMYGGMHFPSDVIAGALLGAASVAAATSIVHRAVERHEREATP